MSGTYKKAKLNWKVTKITMSITILIEKEGRRKDL